MFAIFKREIRSYFQTVVGWLFIAAVLALYGLYFYAYNLRSGSPYVSYSLSAVSFIVMIAVPVLTMRSFAEERHTKTDQLMLTSPVPLGKIVFGKYLAMVGVFSIAMIVVALTPLFLSIYGSVPLGESYVAVLGFWLYGCACIAIGMLMSVVTESQVIAAVLGFAALFLGYMMSSITSMISQSGNLLTKILNAYDLYTPLDKFMNGCLDLTGVIYFLSVIGICLFLSCQLIQKRRYSVSTKKIAPGAFSIGMIVVAFAIAVVVNLVANELPSTVTAIDATSTKLYSITDTTKDYLKTLDQDVNIYVLAAEKNADSTLSETLQRYEDLSGHVKVSYVNPSTNPTFFQKYTTDAPTSNSLIVASDARSRVIDYNDIYEYSYDYSSYSRSLDGYDAEGQITSALQYVTKDSSELPVVYEITGHGETSLSGGFSEAIEKANMTLTELTLLKEEGVPDDASAIIINAPTSDFSADDAKKVTDYLEKGGKALITTNFQYKDLTNFESILKAYGIERVDGIVMENDSSYYYNNIPYYLLPEVESNDYTSSVSGKYIFAPYSEAFSYDGSSDDVTYTALLQTTDKAVSKIDADNAATSEKEDGDIEGPFTIALAAAKTENDTSSQVVVAGSMELFTDSTDQIVSGSNVSMFTDIMTNLTSGEDDNTSVIPVKDYKMSTITITSISTIIGGLAASIFIPVVLIIIGVVIWAVRRKKIMQKQKKQMIVLVILLILLILAYIGVHFYSKKQEEKENAKEEAEKIQVTDLEVSDITQFSYVLDGTTLSFTKNGTEWTYDGDQSVDIDESALETLLNKASAITASDEVTEYDDLADFGLDDPANTVTLKTDSGLTTIYIGSQNEITNEYYLKTGDSDTIYVVDSAPATGFDKSVEDLTAKADDTETEAEEPSEAVDETETATVVPNETEAVETEKTETK
ncbi:MAG: Gldg family protein [Roseburia intestinalis]